MQPDDYFAAVEARQQPAPLFPRTLRRERETMSKRYECDHAGCLRDFATEQALAIHKGRTHGAKIPKPAAGGGTAVKRPSAPCNLVGEPYPKAPEVTPEPVEIPDYRLEAIRAWACLARFQAEMRHADTIASIDRVIELADER